MAITYVGDLEGVCCASRSGLLVQVDCDSLVVAVVGDISTGIVTLAWSPDQGMVGILTGARTLVCMTPSWQVGTVVACGVWRVACVACVVCGVWRL